MKIPLTAAAREALTFQQYGPQPDIDGVLHLPLRKHRMLEGWFMEVGRLTEGQLEGVPFPYTLRQVSVSRATAGRINAFHLHPRAVQDEIWCVLQGTLLVWLVDVREGSSTQDVRRRFVLSGEAPALLYIPSGVAHGYRAGPDGATLLYMMNSQFNAADPNEGRLPWDYFGEELWQEDRG